jgi:catechol 2,3-dioxygenase-like lactoylglutathione lyase family enzyme
MPLTTNNPIAFIPTTDAAAARNFYETALGLNFVSDDNFALVFRVGSSRDDPGGPSSTHSLIVRQGGVSFAVANDRPPLASPKLCHPERSSSRLTANYAAEGPRRS